MELHIFSPLKSDFTFVFLDIAATAHMDSCHTKPSIGIMTSRPQSVTLSETSVVTARLVDIFHSHVSFQILSLLFLTINAYKLSVFSIPIRPGRGYILFFLLILYLRQIEYDRNKFVHQKNILFVVASGRPSQFAELSHSEFKTRIIFS